METTRHFVATVYVVNDGAVALHDHEKLGMWLPPGGHLARDELPHRAAIREAREELGLDVRLLTGEADSLESSTARSIPRPRHVLLEDVDVCGEEVAHQHVDFVYYGKAPSRAIDPTPDEAPADRWEWVSAPELEAASERFAPDVVAVATRAIEAAANTA